MGESNVIVKDGNIHPSDVAPLLQRIDALKIFTYDLKRYRNANWFPPHIYQALRDHSKEILKEANLQ